MLKKARALYRVRIYKIKRLRCSEASFFLTRDVRYSGMRSCRTNRGETRRSFAGMLSHFMRSFRYTSKPMHREKQERPIWPRGQSHERVNFLRGNIPDVVSFGTLLPILFLESCFLFEPINSEILIKNVSRGHHFSIFLFLVFKI